MSDKERMVYVAADPEQPGAAYAITVDAPEYAQDNAKLIADWIRRGANVMRVDRSTGVDMIGKWVRPEKQKKLPPPDAAPIRQKQEE